jgi:hypothetical protein
MERAESDARAKVVDFDDLSSADRIWVQTKRSKYQFSVSDPHNRKGTLTGGLLGDQTLDALFSGTISEDLTDFDSLQLKTGTRAVFFIETENHTERLVTSAITDLAVAKNRASGQCAA